MLTGLSLIVAIGAQNAFVLRLGIEGRNRVIFPVVLICALSDAVLILAGVLGMGALVKTAPVAMVVVRILGAAFLIGYAVFAARRALRPGALVVADEPAAPVAGSAGAGGAAGTGGSATMVSHRVGSATRTGTKVAIGTALALTWLNPHVYLDTVVFLGAVASQQTPAERWWWAGGAMLASLLWFAGLGFGARLLRPVFARPGAWRVLDALIAVVMLLLGLKLAFDL
ncbi:amino acid transporter [Cryobacterium arcticum]|uniref:Amino acid transporter n=2 Tax=Cryobacterium arcticum TaxID=670052 RepID=A0A317ZVU7_9MICO|nr:amino acid transporter [Cryobacterium arcticum]